MKSNLHLRHSFQVATAPIVALCLCLCVETTLAQAARTLSYQGLLTDNGGSPVADATRSMTFGIYDVASDGSPLWTETKDVATVDGVFNTQLGSTNPITGVNFNQDLWLGTTVAGDPEMADRTKLTSTPSAFGLVMPFEDTLTAARFVYIEPDTLYQSIPCAAFVPLVIDSTTNWETGSFLSHRLGNDYAGAPVLLPHGAILKTLSCTFYDGVTEADLSCQLCERVGAGETRCGTSLAIVTSSGNTGYDTYTQPIAGTKTVDNEDKSYYLRVYPVSGSAPAEWKDYGDELEIARANLGYTVARPQ